MAKLMCPGCDKEVELIKDGEKSGQCPECGLDVEWCLEKVRRDKAVDKLKSGNEPPRKTRKRMFDF